MRVRGQVLTRKEAAIAWTLYAAACAAMLIAPWLARRDVRDTRPGTARAELREIVRAQQAYRADHGRYAGWGPLTFSTGPLDPPYLDGWWYEGVERSAYRYTMTLAPGAMTWRAEAVPRDPGQDPIPRYSVDQTGVIRDGGGNVISN